VCSGALSNPFWVLIEEGSTHDRVLLSSGSSLLSSPGIREDVSHDLTSIEGKLESMGPLVHTMPLLNPYRDSSNKIPFHVSSSVIKLTGFSIFKIEGSLG
jgi:hypothetical protein